MEKFKALVPMMAFIAYLIKSLALGITAIDVAALFVLALLYGASEYMHERNEMKLVKEKMNEMQESIKDLQKRSEEIKTHVGGLKLAQQMKPTSFR